MGNKEMRYAVILKSLAANYPILLANGQKLSKALVVTVSEGEAETFLDAMTCVSTVRVDSYTDKSKMREAFTETNSEFICYIYAPCERNQKFLKELLGIAKTRSFDGQPLNAPICIISESIPYGISISEAFFIHMDGSLRNVNIPCRMVVPEELDVPLALDRLRQEVNSSDRTSIFHAAVCFTYPCLKEFEDRDERYKALMEAVTQLTDEVDDYEGTADLCTYFKDAIFRWREKEKFTNVYELPRIGPYAEEHLDSVILYNEDCIYISEELFRKIVEPLHDIVPRNVLMNALAESEIVLPEYRDEYSMRIPVKVNFYSKDGGLKRKRMIRLNREKIREAGKMEFITRCLFKGRKKWSLS